MARWDAAAVSAPFTVHSPDCPVTLRYYDGQMHLIGSVAVPADEERAVAPLGEYVTICLEIPPGGGVFRGVRVGPARGDPL